LIFYAHSVRNTNKHVPRYEAEQFRSRAKLFRDSSQTMVREHAKALNKRFGEDGRIKSTEMEIRRL
jgi:hypothetical protein